MNELFAPGFYTEDDLRDAGFKSIGRNVRVAKNCTILGVRSIALGHDVRIDGYTTISAPDGGFLTVGSHVHIAAYSLLIAGDGIEIQDFAGLSQGVRVYSRSDDYSGRHLTNPTVPERFTGVIRGKVVIERHAIVGSGSVILPGVVVGEGAAIGALSLVRKSVEGWGVYLGAPVRRVGDRAKDLLALEAQLHAEEGPGNGA